MGYKTVAVGDSLDTLRATVPNFEFQTGQKLRWIIELDKPIAFMFDAAGAEEIFRDQMPDGVTLLDVYSPDNEYLVYIDGQANSPALLAILSSTAFKWAVISLISIGVMWSLASLIHSIKLQAADVPKVELGKTAIIAGAVLGGIVLVGKVLKGLK